MSEVNYYAPKSWYDGMAQQVQRLTGTSDKLTIGEMLTGLNGVSESNFQDKTSFTVKAVPKIQACVTNFLKENVFEMFDNIADTEVTDASIPSASIVQNMNKWCKNNPAASAYTDISYNYDTSENICNYTGVAMFEVIGFPLVLEAGKRYTFTVDYYAPQTLTGAYSNPYAPYIAFLPYDALASDADPFDTCYVYTAIDLSVYEYTTYTCTHIPSYNSAGCIALVCGSVIDGEPIEMRLKNICLTIEN